MERLTKMDTQNRLLAYSISDTGLPTLITSGNPYRKLIEKLKSYEDTGLTPGEVIDALTLTDWIQVDERLPNREEWIDVYKRQG